MGIFKESIVDDIAAFIITSNHLAVQSHLRTNEETSGWTIGNIHCNSQLQEDQNQEEGGKGRGTCHCVC